jgi:hypothetical protein
MIKAQDILKILQPLLLKARQADQLYRSALGTVSDSNERVLFIYFWQEHAKILAELEEKIRWLGGEVLAIECPPWGGLHFKEVSLMEERIKSLQECIHQDAETLETYDYALKHPLPVDVRNMIKTHVLKIKGIHARVLQTLTKSSSAASWTSPVAAPSVSSIFSEAVHS